jgi:hypothetical protein
LVEAVAVVELASQLVKAELQLTEVVLEVTLLVLLALLTLVAVEAVVLEEAMVVLVL